MYRRRQKKNKRRVMVVKGKLLGDQEALRRHQSLLTPDRIRMFWNTESKKRVVKSLKVQGKYKIRFSYPEVFNKLVKTELQTVKAQYPNGPTPNDPDLRKSMSFKDPDGHIKK